MFSEKLIKSPLNYTGGKFKLLPQLKPLFPKDIRYFYDIFCGGANVTVNVKAEKILGLDINDKVISLYNYFLNKNFTQLLNEITQVINYYNLSDSIKNGYEFYNCNSSDGLGSFNKEGFQKIKQDYNNPLYNKYDKNLLFYILVVYGFNNQIRFNQKGQFNIPVGKRDFNLKMKVNLEDFINKISSINIEFKNAHFSDFELITDPNSFVYADPPYLITNATYNESDGWNDKKEKELLDFLLGLDKNNIKFALSNVLEHKNKKNIILESWIKQHGFKLHNLNFSYSNSSYQGKDKKAVTKEVLVTNY